MMLILIGDKIVNLDALEILDMGELTPHRHVLRGAVMPLCEFPTYDATVAAMGGIQNGVRFGAEWVEIDPVSGAVIDMGSNISPAPAHDRMGFRKLERFEEAERMRDHLSDLMKHYRRLKSSCG